MYEVHKKDKRRNDYEKTLKYFEILSQIRKMLPNISAEIVEIACLQTLPSSECFLFEWLRPFGFTSAQILQINESLDVSSGKSFSSATHVLYIDRSELIVAPSYQPPSRLIIPEEGVYPYEGDVFLMYSNNAFRDKNKDVNPVNIFSLGLPIETLKEEIFDARLKHDIEQIETWGLMPIVCEIIPEIYGVPPETIKPNRAAYLEKIIGKIQRTAILSEKGIH